LLHRPCYFNRLCSTEFHHDPSSIILQLADPLSSPFISCQLRLIPPKSSLLHRPISMGYAYRNPHCSTAHKFQWALLHRNHIAPPPIVISMSFAPPNSTCSIVYNISIGFDPLSSIVHILSIKALLHRNLHCSTAHVISMALLH
jgi:hypothetical protein